MNWKLLFLSPHRVYSGPPITAMQSDFKKQKLSGISPFNFTSFGISSSEFSRDWAASLTWQILEAQINKEVSLRRWDQISLKEATAWGWPVRKREGKEQNTSQEAETQREGRGPRGAHRSGQGGDCGHGPATSSFLGRTGCLSWWGRLHSVQMDEVRKPW